MTIFAEHERDKLGRYLPGPQLNGVRRCPHCSIVDPHLIRVWSDAAPTPRKDGGERVHWASYRCDSCGSIVSISAYHSGNDRFNALSVFPEPKSAHGDLPEVARAFLQQAFETLHAPDAAAVMAGAAVDAMLKNKGYTDGSLYARIDQALSDNLLTQGMADWAHSVRLGSNRPRHADAEKPHVSADEAKQSVDFAEALGQFLFVLTARIDRGIEAAEHAA